MKWTLIATWKMAAEGMRMAEANLQKSGSADQALETVVDCANQHGLTVAGTAPSPIEGTHGNTEFLLFARMDDIAAKAD